jgi:hypothetical protein
LKLTTSRVILLARGDAMAQRSFVAFASSDPIVSDLITTACGLAGMDEQEFSPWNRNDTSGLPVDQSVAGWVEGADTLVADISEPNHNVTYEIGLALGGQRPVRLIRAASKDRKLLEEIGLLHNIGHDEYHSQAELVAILRRPFATRPWPVPKRSTTQPIYLLKASRDDDLLRRTLSGIKKITRFRFRSFDPREIDRLTATEAYEQAAQSFGVIAIWHDPALPESLRQNQRAAFAVGVAKGMDIPFMLLAPASMRLPLDLDEIATRWSSANDIDRLMHDFRDEIADAEQTYVEIRPSSDRYLDIVHCGDPAAENEATSLDAYFLETEQYRLTVDGALNIILGRKGSGKTAIFLQSRDHIRADRNNIVIDLAPEAFQLIKLKEFILAQLALGTRKEFIAAFWEYIVWLEIARKLLEKDARRSKYDSRIIPQYDRLQQAYTRRVDNTGDFAVRLTSLTDRIVGRYQEAAEANASISSKTLEIVYGSEIRELRDEVLGYLTLKGVVCFLFDNLDRFWTPTGFADVDSNIVVGLVECLQDIRRRLAHKDIEFQWTIFLRSDVFEFVVRGMADYGKLASGSVEWNDRELLLHLFQRRVLQGFGEKPPSWEVVWRAVSVPTVDGKDTLDFLLDASLMRPRYLIRLFEMARRRAVTLSRDRIEEADYKAGLIELGWQVLEDFDRELTDIIPDAESLLFDLSQLGQKTTLDAIHRIVGDKVSDAAMIDSVVDVLIWTGCVGALSASGPVYISDCGFKRPVLRSLMQGDGKSVVFHPTLASIFATPAISPTRASRRSMTDGRQGSLSL